jgi:arylsulfatase A-like enzyme
MKLLTLALIAWAVSLVGCCPCEMWAAEPLPHRPSVLFILIDDLGPEWLSCYGGELIKTLQIDALATAGTRFAACYATPLCSTTRVMLLTGRYPRSTGWIWHHDPSVYGGGGFDWERYLTLPRVFQQSGYATSIAGKWQINNLYEQPEALARHGFDEHSVWPGAKEGDATTASRYWDPYIVQDGRGSQRLGKFGEDEFAEFTIDFMRRHRERPFFAWHAMHLTHSPFTTTPDNRDDSSTGAALFPGMVRYADKIVGRLLAALDELRLRDKTIVVLATDNGSATACRGRMQGREVRGGKGSLRETGIHVPLIVRGPGIVAGQGSDQPVDFTDVLPTLLQLCGIAPPRDATLDGQSLTAILAGKAASLPDRDWSHTQYADVRVIRDRRHKLYSSGELYDLLADPGEQNDLAASASPEAAAARQRLAGVLATFPADATLPFKPRSQSYFKAHPEDRPRDK